MSLAAGAGSMEERSGVTWRAIVAFVVGVAGMAAGITLIFLGMRSVMDIGGACATGGPYVPAVGCPEGVPAAMLLGIFGGMAATALTGVAGARLGGAYAGVAFLGWPALFISLGWNFLEYGLRPPGEEGVAWGWLVCAVVFLVMGGLPLLAALRWRDDLRTGAVMTQLRTTGRPRLRRIAPTGSSDDAWQGDEGAGMLQGSAVPGLVDELERLAALRESGDLTATEYADAKLALLGRRDEDAAMSTPR